MKEIPFETTEIYFFSEAYACTYITYINIYCDVSCPADIFCHLIENRGSGFA